MLTLTFLLAIVNLSSYCIAINWIHTKISSVLLHKVAKTTVLACDYANENHMLHALLQES